MSHLKIKKKSNYILKHSKFHLKPKEPGSLPQSELRALTSCSPRSVWWIVMDKNVILMEYDAVYLYFVKETVHIFSHSQPALTAIFCTNTHCFDARSNSQFQNNPGKKYTYEVPHLVIALQLDICHPSTNKTGLLWDLRWFWPQFCPTRHLS